MSRKEGEEFLSNVSNELEEIVSKKLKNKEGEGAWSKQENTQRQGKKF